MVCKRQRVPFTVVKSMTRGNSDKAGDIANVGNKSIIVLIRFNDDLEHGFVRQRLGLSTAMLKEFHAT